ncbi:MAG: xanthine dehydrogenase family protein subunit M [Candidatus Cloacimonadaceae bacterium]
MAVAHDFKYYRPLYLKETLKLLADHTDKARLLAGGTDLAVYIKEGMEHPEAVIDIKKIEELQKLEIKTGSIFIGANVTFSELLDNQKLKKDYLLLWESARSVASVGIRNRATLVGNICSAVPSMDSAPALLCYDAVIYLQSSKSSRQIPISEWWLAPRKTAKRPDEIVVGVSINKPKVKHTGCYVKLGRYGGEDLAQAGLGLLINAQKVLKIAFCAVGPVPTRAHRIEKLLSGKALTSALLEKAKALVPSEISPISDIRSGKEYRIHMCQIMLERGINACVDRLNGKKVDTLRILGG